MPENFTHLLKLVLLVGLSFFVLACQNENTTASWTDQELGTFEEVQLEDIPADLSEKMLGLINHSKTVRLQFLNPSNDFNSFFSVRSLFTSARELFYLGGIGENISELSCNMASNAGKTFPLLITYSDERRIKEVKLTSKQFYSLHLDFQGEFIIGKLHTIQNITAEQQQKKVFQDVMSQYQKSASMSLPKTVLKRTDTIALQTYRDYLAASLNRQNINRDFLAFIEGSGDTLFVKNPYSEFILFDKEGRITERAFGQKSSTVFSYDEKNNLLEIQNVDKLVEENEEEHASIQSRYYYSKSGTIDSIAHFDFDEKKTQTEVFSYHFRQSDTGFYYASITVQTEGLAEQNESKKWRTDIFFDKKMNWIKIKKLNGEMNRRIEYAN